MYTRAPFFPLSAWARKALEGVHAALEEALPQGLQPFFDALGYELPIAERYPLRPYLLLLVARCSGKSETRAHRLAASVHMIHAASLLHDRLNRISRTSLRKTVPLRDLHQQEALDILLGDFFFSKASTIIVEDGNTRIIKDMIQTSLATAEAQATIVSLDQQDEAPPIFSCFQALADKLSLLLSLSLRVGAIVGDLPLDEETALSDYGVFLGKALRIVQDLQYWREIPEEEHAFSLDVKYSFPLLLLWEKEGRNVWEAMVKQLQTGSRADLRLVQTRIQQGGYMDASLQRATDFAEKASDRLQQTTGPNGLKELLDIARILGSGLHSTF